MSQLSRELQLAIQAAAREAMARRGKLGGQNKVPRLANDREMAEQLLGHG